MRTPTLVPFVALALAACGGASPASTTVPASTTAHASEPALHGPPAPWATLDHDARRAHMVHEVLPRASELFASWRAERYANFSCETCHGADASARQFAMPNPSLITLYPTGTVGQEEVLAQYTEACTFMYSRLVPAMQTMLGAPDYDPATHEGFTCFACHPHATGDDPRSAPRP